MTRTDARACRPIIPIPAALTQLAHAQLLHDSEPPHLLAFLASPTREQPVAAATHWSPSWAWRPPRCWQGHDRSPRSPNGRRRAPAGPGRARRPPAGSWPLQRPGRGHHPPDAFAPGRRRAGRRHRRLAGRPGPGPSLPVAAVPWRWTARRCAAPAQPTAARCTCWPVWTMPAARCWPNARSAAPPRRSLCSSRCWTGSTSPGRSSPPTRSRPARRPPSSWSPACTPTTCSRSRPTSRPCWTVVSACPGTASPSWTAPATAATAASNYAPSKLSGPPAGHGLPAQPGHRRPQPRRAGQPRRRPAPPRPRPTPTPHDPWDYPQVNRARPKNAQSAGCWGIGGGNSVAVDLGGVATVQL
jgi:hypothetical protein